MLENKIKKMKSKKIFNRIFVLTLSVTIIVSGIFGNAYNAQAVTNTFTASETQANVAAGATDTQAATEATTQANVAAGATDTQAATEATTQANVVAGNNDSQEATATTTQANVAVGADNSQAATEATTQANVEEVKASRTLTVGSAPANAETISIGTNGEGSACVVTFSNVVEDDADELNCTDNAATIALTTAMPGAGTLRTATQIAAALRGLTNITDSNHGPLTVGGTESSVSFTTTPTETSGTTIAFTDGTTGNITSTGNVTGVTAVAQIDTITISGTVETGDVFTANLPGDVTATYTAIAGDTTALVAAGLNTAIQASSGYAAQAFTSGAADAVITLTAKVAGTGFTVTSGATNRAAVAQIVTFTPVVTVGGETFRITINGTNYDDTTAATGETVATVVGTLAPLADANAAVGCTEDDLKVTCTASVPGTAFTYNATVVDLTGLGVTKYVPASSATGVAIGASTATVTFNRTITGIVDAAKIDLVDSDDVSVKNAATIVDGKLNIGYDTLTNSTVYRIVIGANAVTDTNGVMNVSSISTFTTVAAAGDTTAPELQSQAPAVGATDVSVNPEDLYVQYDEALDPTTIGSSNVMLCYVSDDDCSDPVSVGSPQIMENGTMIRIGGPSVTLQNATAYWIKITAAVKDLAGNPVAAYGSTTTSNFTTAAVPTGSFTVDAPVMVKMIGTADNSYANGWEWVLTVTLPTDERGLAFKFANWTSGSNSLAAGGNMEYYSEQIASGTGSSSSPVEITAANAYPSNIVVNTDADTSRDGIQTNIHVLVKLPSSTVGGSYTTAYVARSQSVE